MILAIFLVISALLCVLGFVFLAGKGASLIAGYNTASEYEKSRIDEKALCRAMACMMFCMAFSWALVGFGAQFEVTSLKWIGGIVFALSIIVGLIYVNTSKKIKK